MVSLKQACFLITALTINIYWLTVAVKSFLIRSRIGKTPNILPKEWLGLLSRIIMLPMICFWCVLPWYNISHVNFIFSLSLSILGTTLAVIALVLSYYCWYFMGNSWRIGIDPKEKTDLVITGPFKYIRHPIYTLSMLLMTGTFITYQTLIAFYLLCVHFLLFYIEALREETYMLKVHKDHYKNYMRKAGRFLPPFLKLK
jgi:protein-S-isoprenylcysteine O-methyltransferase Ste14